MSTNMYAQPIMVQQPLMDARAARRERNKSTLYKLGITEIVAGLIFYSACIASISISSDAGRYTSNIILIYPGIWCGVFPIISGILGILSRKNPTECLFIANMVMAIFTAIFMAILFSLSVISALIVAGYFFLTALQALNCIGSFALFVVAIIHSAYCCSGSCCYSPSQQLSSGSNYAHGQRFIQLPNGQFVLVQNQPFVNNQPALHAAPLWQPQVGIVQPSTSNQYPQTQMNMNSAPKPETGAAENPPSYDNHGFATNPNYMLLEFIILKMSRNMYASPIMVQQPFQPLMDSQATRRERNKSILFKLGITEIVAGNIFILACITSIVISPFYAGGRYTSDVIFVSSGIWCGIFPIISGILGVLSRKNPTQCLFIANMVMGIFTAIFMAILFSLSIVSALVIYGYFLTALQALNCIGSFALFVVAIIHSAYCCSGSCCYSPSQQLPSGSNYAHGQQFIQLPNGQFVLVQNQPFVNNQPALHAAPLWQPHVGIVQPSTSNQYPQTQMNMNFTPKPETGAAEAPPLYDNHGFAANPNYM
ncbi:uncharacterized protein LOC120341257 [Styela clava]